MERAAVQHQLAIHKPPTMASSSKFSVNKSEGTFVLPLEPTPNHTLPLSWFDRIPLPSTFVEMFFVYKHGDRPAEVIQRALAKALVPYYPLAGRIVRSEKGEITGVACTGDGVWFVDASADCSLEEAMDLLMLSSSEFPEGQLLPSPPNPVGMSIMFQVTQFTCDGFVVGLKYDHIMADGIGIAQIMKAVAEIARGLEQPVVAPVWLREHIPNPTFVNMVPPPLPPPPTVPLEYLVVDVPQDHINQVKARFLEQSGQWCSTFDVAVAQLWQCRARVIGSDVGVVSALGFPADARSLLSDFLPDERGYYGNCVFPVTTSAANGKITEASLFDVVTLIRDAKTRLPEVFAKWARGELDPCAKLATMIDYNMLGVTDWSRLGFSEVDYGWGGPAYFAPVPRPSEQVSPPMCTIIKRPTPEKGCRLITRCVKKEHIETFSKQMINFSEEVKGACVN